MGMECGSGTWAVCQQLPRRCEYMVNTCLSLILRTRQHVFSTSDKARLVSLYAFDLDQSCSSRQHDLEDVGTRMLQCNATSRLFLREAKEHTGYVMLRIATKILQIN